MSADIEPIIQFFSFAHLPPAMQEVSRPFCDLAVDLMEKLPRNPERTVALRKLLEAKDAAVRAAIFKEAPRPDLPGAGAADSVKGAALS